MESAYFYNTFYTDNQVLIERQAEIDRQIAEINRKFSLLQARCMESIQERDPIQVQIKPIFEAVQDLPDDVLAHIGKFINVKKLVAQERLDILNQSLSKVYLMKDEQWLAILSRNHSWLPRIIKICPKNIKVQQHELFNSKYTVSKEKLTNYLIPYYAIKLRLQIVIRTYQILGKPIQERQRMTVDGIIYESRYQEIIDRGMLYNQIGCANMKLVWIPRRVIFMT